MGVVRVIALVAVGMVLAACFGKLAVSVSNEVQPAVILPGGAVGGLVLLMLAAVFRRRALASR